MGCFLQLTNIAVTECCFNTKPVSSILLGRLGTWLFPEKGTCNPPLHSPCPPPCTSASCSSQLLPTDLPMLGCGWLPQCLSPLLHPTALPNPHGPLPALVYPQRPCSHHAQTHWSSSPTPVSRKPSAPNSTTAVVLPPSLAVSKMPPPNAHASPCPLRCPGASRFSSETHYLPSHNFNARLYPQLPRLQQYGQNAVRESAPPLAAGLNVG